MEPTEVLQDPALIQQGLQVGAEPTTFLEQFAMFFQDGGIFMYIIAIIWIIGLVIAADRYIKLKFRLDIDGPSFMNELQRYILSNDIQGAIRVCSGSIAALPRVLKSGLKRASHSTDQVQNAIDATALEVIPKVEKRIGYLNLIANISTLLGLLGTIFGLIQSFAAVSQADPQEKAELLSRGISKAMNTTAAGLIAAISIMIIHAFLVSRSEKIVNEIDEFSVKLLDLLGTKKETQNE
jgi:biopolymer transport protein ExbB/TolQ